jgi:hypothetical protein
MSNEVQQESELLEERDLLIALTKTAGWQIMQDRLSDQINSLTNGLFEPLQSRDEVLAEQFNKGLAKGLLFALGYPKSQIERLNESLDQIDRKREVDGNED